MKKILLGAAILAVAAILFRQVAQPGESAESQDETPIQDETILEVGDLAVTVSATGTITPIRQVGLVFEFSAPVAEVLVTEGQRVAAGQVLARLDTRDLDIALENARVSLDAQQVAYDALTAPPREVDIAVAQAALNVARAQSGTVALGAESTQLEIARIQAEIARNQLWQSQLQRDLAYAVPPVVRDYLEATGQEVPDNSQAAKDDVRPELNRADYEVLIADANLAALQNEGADVAGLSAAYAQIAAAQSQLERLLNGPSEMDLQIAGIQLQVAQLALEQAEANRSRAVLTAPFAGVVAENNLVVGEMPPQGAAIQLADLSGYYVDVSVDETDIVDVREGQRTTLLLDALPGAVITGRVTRVAATPARAGQLVAYVVRVTLDLTNEPVRAGMTATATILVSELQNILVLPNRFVRIDRATQQAYVTVERPGGFEEVPVQLGLRNDTDSQIVNGLEAGQRVVLLPRATFNPIPGT
ncbi:MAG: HlyD family efflux transporter periplasmic adaptor subunit [Chloroflexi bacterium]|nr:HlyD family efflux transporter periplasmic adaptor subunit [Chloroflexota bacterium]